MNEEERRKIISNEYVDIIVEYKGNQNNLSVYQQDTINIIDFNYAVVHYPYSRVPPILSNEIRYAQIPKLYGLLDTSAIDAMGVRKLQSQPYLALRGQGVLLGFVDTGIDYTNPLFKKANNTTRILSIWDQTVENMEASKDIYYYGKEYSMEQINLAIMSSAPVSVVPSMDENGHGTMMAAYAGGSQVEEKDFEGVATLADYVIVKVKPAKQVFRDYFFVNEDAVCYQENDIMFGIEYLINYASRLKRPIAICIGVGTNQTSHDGTSSLEKQIGFFANEPGRAIVVAGGNERNSGHHYFAMIDPKKGSDSYEINVAENESGFATEIWGNSPGAYSIDILSPSGEYIPRIPARFKESRTIKFLFEDTIIYVSYLLLEPSTGDQLIFMRFSKPTKGIWRITVYGQGDVGLAFHSWLPIQGFIKKDTFFVKPNPETTITSPGNSKNVITSTAYNHKNNSIYLNASMGYNRVNEVKPDLAAPGVEVYGPLPGNEYGSNTGTSVAAAYTTGISALLLEWGILRGQYESINTGVIKKFLIRGANRSEVRTYPNKEWGYGALDIYRTFNSLRGEVES